jgi:hypothetical protein
VGFVVEEVTLGLFFYYFSFSPVNSRYSSCFTFLVINIRHRFASTASLNSQPKKKVGTQTVLAEFFPDFHQREEIISPLAKDQNPIVQPET